MYNTNMKTGITFSAFDLFHSGHVAMLKEARNKCDYLMVGLQTDPTIDRPEKNKPILAPFLPDILYYRPQPSRTLHDTLRPQAAAARRENVKRGWVRS